MVTEFTTTKKTWVKDFLAHGIRLELLPEERCVEGDVHPNLYGWRDEYKRILKTKRGAHEVRAKLIKVEEEIKWQKANGRVGRTRRLLDLQKRLPHRTEITVRLDWDYKFPILIDFKTDSGKCKMNLAFDKDWLES